MSSGWRKELTRQTGRRRCANFRIERTHPIARAIELLLSAQTCHWPNRNAYHIVDVEPERLGFDAPNQINPWMARRIDRRQ